MTHAYSELYISAAQRNMGDMMHYAVYDLEWGLSRYHKAFINSGIARRFGVGEPKFTVGMSGAELACEVVHAVTGRWLDIEPSYAPVRSPEYWTGWALAYYEWWSGTSFEQIERCIPIEEILDMYHPYHEADITKFVDEIDRRIYSGHYMNQLARLRSYAGLTQKALAERSGVSVRMIEQYEQGRKELSKASASTIYDLSKVLHCRMEDLMV